MISNLNGDCSVILDAATAKDGIEDLEMQAVLTPMWLNSVKKF